MSKTEVAVKEAALPALADTPSAAPLDYSDVSKARLYRGEFQSPFVQTNLVPSGCIYTATDKDDPEPEVLIKDAVKAEKGVLVHILQAWKNKSYQYPKDQGGEFKTWAFNDSTAHPDARVGYQYLVCLPEVDGGTMPVKLTLAKTSRKCGERINFRLLSHTTGPPHELAFRLTLKAASREDGGQTQRWFVWQEKFEDADPANVATADALARLLPPANPVENEGSAPTNATAVDDGPAI